MAPAVTERQDWRTLRAAKDVPCCHSSRSLQLFSRPSNELHREHHSHLEHLSKALAEKFPDLVNRASSGLQPIARLVHVGSKEMQAISATPPELAFDFHSLQTNGVSAGLPTDAGEGVRPLPSLPPITASAAAKSSYGRTLPGGLALPSSVHEILGLTPC